MHAVLLFSAAVHVAALGLFAAFALRNWLETRRPKEPSFPETAMAAGSLAGVTALVALLLMWPARGFGHGLLTGLVAGALVAASFLLTLGAWPQRPTHGGPPSQASRITAGVFVTAFLVMELVAFCFLAAAAGR